MRGKEERCQATESTYGGCRPRATRWSSGPRLARQFSLAPAGEHRAIPEKILPGPYNEATTWFGGPAPDSTGLERLLRTFRFTDPSDGATLSAVSGLLVQQPDVSLIGRSDRSVPVFRRAAEMSPTLPEWAGLRLPGGELWRAGRVLDRVHAGLVADGPHQWRYLLAVRRWGWTWSSSVPSPTGRR